MDAIAIQRKDRRDSLIASIVFHALLCVLFLFVGMKTWDPPLPEEMIEVAMADFGNSPTGLGEVESPDPGAQQQTAPAVAEENPEEVATNDKSDVAVVKPKEKPKDKPKDKPKEEKVSNALQNALNQWNKGGQSQGENQGHDNEGRPDGTPGGKGIDLGNGISVRLGDRGVSHGPHLNEKPSEAGTVVLNIWVDRTGKVLRVSQNLDKSTTTSQTLFNLAKKAAMQCVFSAKPDAAAEQKGEMTFVFILE